MGISARCINRGTHRTIPFHLEKNGIRINDLKEKGYADNTLDGVHRTGRMIFKKAIEMRLIKNDPMEFAYLKKDRKTVEELEEQEIPKYMEKEDLALLLQTALKRFRVSNLSHPFLYRDACW